MAAKVTKSFYSSRVSATLVFSDANGNLSMSNETLEIPARVGSDIPAIQAYICENTGATVCSVSNVRKGDADVYEMDSTAFFALASVVDSVVPGNVNRTISSVEFVATDLAQMVENVEENTVTFPRIVCKCAADSAADYCRENDLTFLYELGRTDEVRYTMPVSEFLANATLRERKNRA